MKNTTRISNAYLSVRLVSLSNNYGLTTVGQLKKFLNKCQPDTKLSVGFGGSIRATKALSELD